MYRSVKYNQWLFTRVSHRILFCFNEISQQIVSLLQIRAKQKQNCNNQMSNSEVHQYEEQNHKDRISNSTANSQQTAGQKENCGFQSPCVTIFNNILETRNQLLVNSKVEQTEITEKATSKAVNWLVTTCWTNDLSDQTLYISIILFYCYKANRIIPKAKLQLILLSSIFLSTKKCQTKKFKINDVLALSTKKFEAEELIQTQYEMLELLDYNLQFKNNLMGFFWRSDIAQQKMDQIQFLTQLSLFQGPDILFYNDIFQELIQTVINSSCPSNYQQSVLKLSKLKQTKVLCNKYASKFDAEEFLNDLFNLYQ